MELSGVHHVSINVSDLEDTLSFYTETVGLAVLPRPDTIGPGVWLGCPDGREVHLLMGGEVPGNLGQHFAFQVANADETRETLAASGRKVSDISMIDGVCRQVFCRDPSGNLLEFNEQLT